MDFDWFNFTASDDDEFCLGQFENYRQDTTHARAMGEQTQPSFSRTTQVQQLQKSKESPVDEKRLPRTYSDTKIVKRRRGPNKNQKVLTEEERKKKKAKALCRNAESARTCRGKRKQAEEKLKIKSANMERDFHILCQTRRELGQELFGLLEEARNIKDPRLLEAVDQAAVRLSSLMTQGQMIRELLDLDSPPPVLSSQQLPLESLTTSRRGSGSSTLQQTSAHLPMTVIEYPSSSSPTTTTHSPTTTTSPTTIALQQSKVSNETNSDGLNWYQQPEDMKGGDKLADTTQSQIGLQLSQERSSINASTSQKDVSIVTEISENSIQTPRQISMAQEDESNIIREQPQQNFSSSPNPFMGDASPQESLEKTQLFDILPNQGSPFHGQLNIEQKLFGYMFPPSPMPLYENNTSPTAFDGQLFMQLNPSSLDTTTYPQQILELSFSQPPIVDQPSSSMLIDESGPSEIDSAIAQLINYT